jgi:subtilisin family serine protease
MKLRRLLTRPRRLVAVAVVLGVVGIGTTGALAEPVSGDGRYIVAFAPGVSSQDQAAEIAAVGATDVSAMPALNLHAVDASDIAVAALTSNPDVVHVEADRLRNVQAVPSDPEYPNQWALPRVGWDQARESTFPLGSATVAVLDTGVDASHPDLAGQLVPGTSMIDASEGTSDANGHGTWMAGIVAAATDNGIGVAGIGFAGVDVMPVKVLSADGTGQDSDIISGVLYAADHGADVILMSFSNPGYSYALQAAIDYAWSNGAVVVAATGNEGLSEPTFPAGDRGVVGVSSTDFNDTLDLSSNYGADTFIAAPGSGIETTATDGGYTTISGTSAAAAEVAGAAALLRASSFDATNGVIVGRLARNADAAGTADQTGNGRLNLARATADTSTDPIEPMGAAPVGGGGPYVGPYVAAAAQAAVTFPADTSIQNTSSYNAGNSTAAATSAGRSTSTTAAVLEASP